MAQDAIDLLKEDHKNVKGLFKEFRRVAKEGGHEQERKQLVQRITEELTVHSWIEEQYLYPRAAQLLKPEDKQEVFESEEEHTIVKRELSELERMSPSDERYNAKVEVLAQNVEHHIEEEEDDLLPDFKKQVSREDLDRLGEEMARAKAQAPRSPSQAGSTGMGGSAMGGGYSAPATAGTPEDRGAPGRM
jgi:hemerythrin-like domain-containing protein